MEPETINTGVEDSLTGKTAAQSIVLSSVGGDVGKEILGMELVDPSTHLFAGKKNITSEERRALAQQIFDVRGSAAEYGANLVAFAIRTFGLCSTDFYRQWGAINHTMEGATGLPRIINSALLAYYSPQTHAGQNLIGSIVRTAQTVLRKGRGDYQTENITIPFHQFIQSVVKPITEQNQSPVAVLANILRNAEAVYDELEELWFTLDELVASLGDDATLDKFLTTFQNAIEQTGIKLGYLFHIQPANKEVPIQDEVMKKIIREIHDNPAKYGIIKKGDKYYVSAVKTEDKNTFYELTVEGETVRLPAKKTAKVFGKGTEQQETLYELQLKGKYIDQQKRAGYITQEAPPKRNKQENGVSLTTKQMIKKGLNYVLGLNIQTDDELLSVLLTNKDALALLAIFSQKDFGVFNENGLNEKVLNFLRNIYHYGADELPTMDTRMMELFGLFNFSEAERNKYLKIKDGLSIYRSKIRDALFDEEVYHIWADESKEFMEGVQQLLLEKTGVLLTIPEIQAALWNAIRSVADTGTVEGADIPNIFAHLFPKTVAAVLEKALKSTTPDAPAVAFVERIFGSNYVDDFLKPRMELMKKLKAAKAELTELKKQKADEAAQTAKQQEIAQLQNALNEATTPVQRTITDIREGKAGVIAGNNNIRFEGGQQVEPFFLKELQEQEEIPYQTQFLKDELDKIKTPPTVDSGEGTDNYKLRVKHQEQTKQFVEAFLKASQTEKTILPRKPSPELIQKIATILQDKSEATKVYRERLERTLTNPNVPENIFKVYQEALATQGIQLRR